MLYYGGDGFTNGSHYLMIPSLLLYSWLGNTVHETTPMLLTNVTMVARLRNPELQFFFCLQRSGQPAAMSLGEFAACTSPTRYSGDTISTPGGYSRDTRMILRRSSCSIPSRKPVGAACDQHFQTHLQFHLKVPGPKRRPSKQRIAATAHASEGMSDKVLITFDVDGTLMEGTGLQANLLHKKAFSHAFLQVFGVEGTIDAIKHYGSTDPLVILNTLEHYGIPQEIVAPKLGELKAKMLEYAMQHTSEVGEGLELLPGVRNLLEVLSRQDEVVIGLVTGNLEDIAWLKMEGLGILQYFSVPNFGGFGSDHTDRGELVRIAAARAEQLFPGGFRLRAHVGDTPNDIRAAEFGGALAIGVTTGIFTQKDLREASHSDTPAVILDNVQNVTNFMNILGLRSRDF